MRDRDWNTFSENYNTLADFVAGVVSYSEMYMESKCVDVPVAIDEVDALVSTLLALDNILNGGRRVEINGAIQKWNDNRIARCEFCHDTGHSPDDCPDMADTDDLL